MSNPLRQWDFLALRSRCSTALSIAFNSDASFGGPSKATTTARNHAATTQKRVQPYAAAQGHHFARELRQAGAQFLWPDTAFFRSEKTE